MRAGAFFGFPKKTSPERDAPHRRRLLIGARLYTRSPRKTSSNFVSCLRGDLFFVHAQTDGTRGPPQVLHGNERDGVHPRARPDRREMVGFSRAKIFFCISFTLALQRGGAPWRPCWTRHDKQSGAETLITVAGPTFFLVARRHTTLLAALWRGVMITDMMPMRGLGRFWAKFQFLLVEQIWPGS